MPWKGKRSIRVVYSAMYSLFLVAGVIAFFYPAQSIMNALQSGLVYTWAAFLAGGGGTSLYAAVRNKWSGEMIGLPMLSAANAIFGSAVVAYGSSNASYAIGLIFWGIAFGLFGRWLELRRLVKRAQEVIDGS